MRSLEELKELSRPAFEHEELIEIACTASSNTEAKNRALEFTKEQELGEKVAMACRWLRMFHVQAGEEEFESFILQQEEEMTSEEKVSITRESSVQDRAFHLSQLGTKRVEELEKDEPQNREEMLYSRKEIERIRGTTRYYYRVAGAFPSSFFASELGRVFGAKVKSYNYYPSSGSFYHDSIWHPDEAYMVTVDIFGGLGYFKLTVLPWRLAAFIEFYNEDGVRRSCIWVTGIHGIETEIFHATSKQPLNRLRFIKDSGEKIDLRSCGIHHWSLADRLRIIKETEVPMPEMNRNPQMESYVGPGFLCSCKNDALNRMAVEE